MRRRVGRGPIILIGGTATALAIRFVTSVLVAQAAGPATRGIYAALGTAVELLDRAFAFGRPQAIAYFTHRGRAGRTEADAVARRLVRAVPIALGVGVLAALLPGFHGAGLPSAIVVVLVLTIIPISSSTESVYRDLQLGRGDPVGPTVAEGVRAVVPLVVAVLALLVFGVMQVLPDKAQNAMVLAGVGVGELLAMAFIRRRAHRADESKVIPRPLPPDQRATGDEIRRFGRSAFPSVILQPLNQRADQLVLAVMIDASDLGLYASAVSLSLLVGAIGVALGQSVYPLLKRFGDRSTESAAFRHVAKQALAIFLVLAVPAVVVVLIWAEPILRILFGPEFVAAAPATRLLIVGALLTGAAVILQSLLIASGNQRHSSRGQIITFVAQMVALPFLVFAFGFTGAAISSVASYAIRLVLLAYWFHQATRNELVERRDDGDGDDGLLPIEEPDDEMMAEGLAEAERMPAPEGLSS